MRLIRIALLTATLAFVVTGSARAQYELTWDKCPGSYGAATNKMFACDDAAQPMVLVASFTPQRSLPRFVGVEFKFEIASASGDLPDWWRAGLGECREGGVSTSNSPGMALGQCQNPWLGARSGGGYLFTSNLPGRGRAELQMTYARDEMKALSAGTRYYAGTITIDPAGSSSGSCGGCNTEVCIAITEITITQEAVEAYDPDGDGNQDPNPENEISVSHSTTSNIVSFNVRNPGANGCGAKVRNKTWGQVKAIYRR
jgi:hypothetical protein